MGKQNIEVGDGLTTIYTAQNPDAGKIITITLHNGHLISWTADRLPGLSDYPMNGQVTDGMGHASYSWPVGGSPFVLGDSGGP